MSQETRRYPTLQQPKTPAEVLRITFPFLASLASMASVTLLLALVDSIGK